jgi:hypothetical protein
MHDWGGLCIKDTLINDIIKEITILLLKVFQVLDDYQVFVITEFIKG